MAEDTAEHKPRKLGVLLIIVVGLVLLGAFAFRRNHQQRFVAKTYFTNVAGLHVGAAVRVAGVDVGSVNQINIRPELHEHPAEIVMMVTTPELRIPSDSVVLLSTEGVLGQTFVDIDIAHASGPPLSNEGVLASRENDTETQEIIRKIGDALIQGSKSSTSTAGSHPDAKK